MGVRGEVGTHDALRRLLDPLLQDLVKPAKDLLSKPAFLFWLVQTKATGELLQGGGAPRVVLRRARRRNGLGARHNGGSLPSAASPSPVRSGEGRRRSGPGLFLLPFSAFLPPNRDGGKDKESAKDFQGMGGRESESERERYIDNNEQKSSAFLRRFLHCTSLTGGSPPPGPQS